MAGWISVRGVSNQAKSPTRFRNLPFLLKISRFQDFDQISRFQSRFQDFDQISRFQKRFHNISCWFFYRFAHFFEKFFACVLYNYALIVNSNVLASWIIKSKFIYLDTKKQIILYSQELWWLNKAFGTVLLVLSNNFVWATTLMEPFLASTTAYHRATIIW